MKKHYQAYFFDLDGTVTDSGPGIMNSVAYALQKMGVDEENEENLRRFIGPPLLSSFQQFYGFTKEDALRSVSFYREYFEKQGMFENEVYAGMESLLMEMKARGMRVIVATSKPEYYAVQILEHFGLLSYFDRVAGSTMGEKRTKKEDVIAYALEKEGLSDAVLMIGDREQDVYGARIHGLNCLGVLYGYGTRKELEAAGAFAIVKNIEELRKFILS